LLGGLFGGKDKKPPKQQSITASTRWLGYFGAGDTTTKHTGDVTSNLGLNASNAINTFLASIGGQVSGALPGQNDVEYYGRTPRFVSVVGGERSGFGNDAQGARTRSPTSSPAPWSRRRSPTSWRRLRGGEDRDREQRRHGCRCAGCRGRLRQVL
jgi:hypothetical protein